jgi:hypothetical protein
MTRMTLAVEGDRHDEDGQRHVPRNNESRRTMIEVEQPERLEGEQGVQAGAGVCHEQLVLADDCRMTPVRAIG